MRSSRCRIANPLGTIFFALLCGLVAVAFLACGSIVTSRRSETKYSEEKKPIKVGDVIFYYLPTGVIKVDGIYEPTKGWSITVTPDIHADAAHRYELSLNQRYPFFDHTALLTTDDKGLLSTVNATSTDRTVDAIGALVTAAGQVLEFGASLAKARALDDSGPPPFHVTLDPFEPTERVKKAEGFTISVNAPPEGTRAIRKEEASHYKGRYGGIMTRLTMPFVVKITPAGGESAKTTVLLPDRRQDYLLAVPRAPVVASETKIGFANGSMISRDMNRPSVVYGILGIPKTILSALVPIPGAVRGAEITRIQNQTTLIKERIELEKVKNPSPSPTTSPSVSPSPTPTPSE